MSQDSDGDGHVACEIRDYVFSTVSCPSGSVGDRFVLAQGQPAGVQCRSESMFDPNLPTLSFEQPRTVGLIDCQVLPGNSVECTDRPVIITSASPAVPTNPAEVARLVSTTEASDLLEELPVTASTSRDHEGSTDVACGYTSNDGIQAACVLRNHPGGARHHLWVVLPGERMLIVSCSSGLDRVPGESCDTLTRFAQIAIPLIPA
jgi:hypothetical protein